MSQAVLTQLSKFNLNLLKFNVEIAQNDTVESNQKNLEHFSIII